MQFFIVGTIKSYGVLYTELDEHYSVGSGPLAFINSIITLFALGFGKFIIAFINDRVCVTDCIVIIVVKYWRKKEPFQGKCFVLFNNNPL